MNFSTTLSTSKVVGESPAGQGDGGAGEVLPHMVYVGVCGPKGYPFLTLIGQK